MITRCSPLMTCLRSALVLGATTLASGAPSAVRADVSEVLTAYAAGQHDVVSSLERVSTADLVTARRIAVRGRGVRPQVGAAFLLELAHRYKLRPPDNPGAEGAAEAGRVLEAACSLADGRGVSLAFQKAFHAATLSAISGRGVLVPSPQFDFDRHARHAAPFVDPGEIALVRATYAEFSAWWTIEIWLPSMQNATPLEAGPSPVVAVRGTRPLSKDRVVRAAVQALTDAASFPAVRAEAWVRIAALSDAVGQTEEAARALVAAAAGDPDVWVQYVIALVAGRIHERAGRTDAARHEFRKAAALLPDARSAKLALAANLYASRLPHEAELQLALSPPAGGADPWDQYFDGHRRFWPERRNALRSLLP